jgi:hypothetical protein
MDRFPVVITAGGGLLGWIGGGMLLTDPALPSGWREIVPYSSYLASAVGALLVVAVGKWLASRQHPLDMLSRQRSEGGAPSTEGEPHEPDGCSRRRLAAGIARGRPCHSRSARPPHRRRHRAGERAGTRYRPMSLVSSTARRPRLPPRKRATPPWPARAPTGTQPESPYSSTSWLVSRADDRRFRQRARLHADHHGGARPRFGRRHAARVGDVPRRPSDRPAGGGGQVVRGDAGLLPASNDTSSSSAPSRYAGDAHRCFRSAR